MAIYRFADFELDEELRQLRLRGREVALQPRAFDVLAYLVEHRARVVDKDELLETIWPGVVVTDSSLQRAVSLARAALRSGGVDDAIRTYARRGYRFIPELVAGAADRSGGDDATDVTEAKALFDSGSWTEAANAFERADSHRPLAAAELECWGIALQCAGTTPAAVEPFQRAAEVYSARNEWEAAARTVIVLARLHFEMQDWAVAKGCLQRAATMLDGLALCEQHGHLAWMRSWLASYEGVPSKTLDHARETVDIGRQLGNNDLEAIGLLFWGIALQASGDAQRGLELQDEAGAVVLTGSVTPLLGGLVYCGLIGGCCNTGDWPRAGQWSESFSAWCRRNGVQRFSGSCLLHRVEVFVARGELDRAEDEIRQNDGILKLNGEWAIAAAQRFLGDVHFLRGEFQPAETAYRSAYEHGTDPHPGYALLLHRRGHSQAAIRALRRSAEGVTWESMERKPLYLAVAAAIAAESGEAVTAEGIIRELEGRPGSWSLGTTRAHVLRARGELDLCRGEIAKAASFFRQALHIHQDMDAALEAAAVRLRLCRALLLLGDTEGAALELDSGERVLTRNQAHLYRDDCGEMRSMLASLID